MVQLEDRAEEGAGCCQNDLMCFHLAILTQEGAVTQGGATEQAGQGAGQAGDVIGISNTDIFRHSYFY